MGGAGAGAGAGAGRSGALDLRSQAIASANASGTLFECEHNCGFRGTYDVVAEHERTCSGPAAPVAGADTASGHVAAPAIPMAAPVMGAGAGAADSAAAGYGRHNTQLVTMPPHASGTIRI